jgi:radical SAM protein with 4Fe4S-binding SPASM domain
MIHELNFYRPEWTCGKYKAEKQVALMYNLIEGMSYFFDEHSATVIGEVLAVPRNEIINVQTVVKSTGIAKESILDFFEELSSIGLLFLSHDKPTKEYIERYRKEVGERRCTQTQIIEKTTQEKLPFQNNSAEMDYYDAAGGVTSAMFELTYNCSEQCVHCYNPGATRNENEKSRRADRQELKLDDYKRIIDELFELGLVKVCLSGGDPFSKPEVWNIIEYLYQKEIATDVFTNAQALNATKIKCLANYYPRLVGISIYSGVAEDHDFITRKNGSWQKSMTAVKQLSELAVPMNLKCCIMRPNIKSYYLVAEMAKQYGAVPQFEISITDSVEGDRCACQNLRLPPEMLEIVLRDNNVPLYVGKEAPNFGGQAKPMDRNPCGAGDNSFCITPEGNVQVCVAFPQVLGNLKTQTMAEILEKSPELKNWRNSKLDDYEECGKYDYCAYCNLCPGTNFITHGSHLKAAENNCYIAKTRYGLVQKMMQGYDPLQNTTLKDSLSTLDNTIQPLKQAFAHCFRENK